MTGIMQMFVGGAFGGGVAPGSQSYTTAGTYSWVAPAGVTAVSVVAVGAGSRGGSVVKSFLAWGGGGGGLGYINNYSVTPGASYTVVVGAASAATSSYFVSTGTVRGGSGNATGTGGTYTGTSGGNGGAGGTGGVQVVCCCGTVYYVPFLGGGGGAGGYAGNGGLGGNNCGCGLGTGGGNPTFLSGGGGGGGGAFSSCIFFGAGGGGVGLFGNTACGTGGAAGSPGTAGSGGSNGSGMNGGAYGGGGGNFCCSTGAVGAVRIVWPGNTRTFPSTCVGSP